VNELLMEAQLLQVSLPEIQELYQTLLTKPSSVQQADRSSPVRSSSEKVSESKMYSLCLPVSFSLIILQRGWLCL
jgi:hypothetical protein